MKVNIVLALTMMSVLLVSSRSFAKEKEAGQTIDAGSFGVFVNAQKVATETFTIQQVSSGTVVNAQFHEEGSAEKASQTSQMQLTSSGDLIHYEWHEQSPGQSQLEIAPNDQFLTERVTVKPGEKPAEQPFLMPTSTVMLDNNFFIHRELLIWRYLSQNCKQESANMQCPSAPTSFGVVVPQDRISMRVTLEPVGREKVQIRGSQRELPRFDLKFEGGVWSMWLDDHDHYKVLKIAIPNEKAEIVRD